MEDSLKDDEKTEAKDLEDKAKDLSKGEKSDKGGDKKHSKDWLIYVGAAVGGVLLFFIYEHFKGSSSASSTTASSTTSQSHSNSNLNKTLGSLLQQSKDNGMMIDSLSLQNWSGDGQLETDITGSNNNFKTPTWRPPYVVSNEYWVTGNGAPSQNSNNGTEEGNPSAGAAVFGNQNGG